MPGLIEAVLRYPQTSTMWAQSGNMSGLVETIRDRCKRCYNCVRTCPARAIKVEEGQAKVIAERCVGCGHCVRVCTQSAKIVESGIRPLATMLDAGDRVVAALAPSFPVAFSQVRPGQVVSALKRLGFSEVFEVAFGAELVSREMARLITESKGLLISTACPAVVSYVEKYLPALVPNLAPVVSPMVAVGRYVKAVLGPAARVVFIGPCIAKKDEIKDAGVAGAVDAAITFYGIKRVFEACSIDLPSLPDECFDGPEPGLARVFPMPGGLVAAAGIHTDLTKDDVVVTHGQHSTLSLLDELAGGSLTTRLADVLFCDGCLDGPRIESEVGLFTRRQQLAQYVRSPLAHKQEQDWPPAEGLISLSRSFVPHPVLLRVPSEEEIRDALRRVNKLEPGDELNCGACGYETCREKATAVCQGIAESQMCLPYLIDQLQDSYTRLERMHGELSELDRAKSRFVRLVSHELRAPIGAIMQYVDVLLSGAVRSDEERGQRALRRCQERGAALLNLIDDVLNISAIEAGGVAEHREELDISDVLEETVELFRPQAETAGVILELERRTALHHLLADRGDMARLFANLVSNAVKYNRPGGWVKLIAGAEEDCVRIDVADGGLGISAEALPHLFEEFFRVREKDTRNITGTGLGLSIVKAIVKAHRGRITVQSTYGQGTTFSVFLPAFVPPPRRRRDVSAADDIVPNR